MPHSIPIHKVAISVDGGSSALIYQWDFMPTTGQIIYALESATYIVNFREVTLNFPGGKTKCLWDFMANCVRTELATIGLMVDKYL